MKILIVGTGAVGGFFGAHLLRVGNDVTFIARGKQLKALQTKGLSIKSLLGDFRIEKVDAIERPCKGIKFDLVIFSVKCYDLLFASNIVDPIIDKGVNILSLLNGVESEGFLISKYGKERVIGGLAYIGASIESPGEIRHSAAGFITIGELFDKSIDRCKNLKSEFDKSDIKCRISENIHKDIWNKMVWNVGFNAITAITNSYAKDILSNERTRHTIVQSMKEAVDVAESMGVSLSVDIVSKTIEWTKKTKGTIKTSMLQDIEKKHKTEVDYINGSIVKIGKEAGVKTPVNETLCNLVKFLELRN